ncbi:MAG: serine/threonine protein kinase, partial [Kofleriaceae bacterium]
MGGLPSGAGALVGKRLGQYELLALLALGGTAEIYLARVGGTAGFEKYVVVKCLHDHLAYDREFVQMFLDEARLGAQLDHSNIVQTLGLGEQDGRYYLVMEFVAGMSLALMARRAVERVPRGHIPVPLVLGIAVQACEGLHYAHEKQSGGKPLNLIHRDISPQNLVITFEGMVKVVDFGIAKAEERETATRSGTIKGKFAYMSPEQCQAKDIDRRTDVFALGVVLHELLTGRRLFKRGSAYDTYQAILECKVPVPSAQNHELDPALDPILMKALAKNPSQRYPSAEAFGEALTNYLHTRGKSAGPGDIALFIDQYYGPEINDHGARMRELLAGRTAAAAGWDDEDGGSGSASVSQVDEVSQFEIIGDDDGPDAGASDAGSASGDDEIAGESTRIEMNPVAKLEELNERVRRESQPRPAVDTAVDECRQLLPATRGAVIAAEMPAVEAWRVQQHGIALRQRQVLGLEAGRAAGRHAEEGTIGHVETRAQQLALAVCRGEGIEEVESRVDAVNHADLLGVAATVVEAAQGPRAIGLHRECPGFAAAGLALAERGAVEYSRSAARDGRVGWRRLAGGIGLLRRRACGRDGQQCHGQGTGSVFHGRFLFDDNRCRGRGYSLMQCT